MEIDLLKEKIHYWQRLLVSPAQNTAGWGLTGMPCFLQRKHLFRFIPSLSVLFLMILGPFQSGFAQIGDSTRLQRDTLPVPDSLRLPLDGFRLSKDALDAEVLRSAKDSSILDNVAKKAFLYGDASVSYQDVKLTAGLIVFEWENDIVVAKPFPDSSGRLGGFPTFDDGTQKFTADSIKYNFKSGKGIVYDVRTNQDDIYILGERSKFIRGQGADSTRNDFINTERAIFTTCTHTEPHFGIRSNKVKIIPNKLAIVGPSQLEIMGVPTPLWFPFGFFPLKSGRSTGLIFPNDYEYSPQLGFGLRGVGWFFPMGEHVNLTLTSNIYLKGSYGLNVNSQYNKRYKYTGNLNLGFDSRKVENTNDGTFSRSNSYSIRFSHRQDRRAHPTNTFGGSVNIQTNDFQSRVFNDAQNVLNSQLSSNLTFSKNWTDKPFSFSAGLNHSQNNQTRQMNISFPNAKFITQSLYPFRKQGGKEKWYENTVVRYTNELKNRFQTADTLLFTQQTLENAQLGMKQNINLSNSFKFLKNFNFNPTANYNEVWYMKSLRKNFDPTQDFQIDTIYNADSTAFQIDTTVLSYGSVDRDTLRGFSSYRTYSVGASVNTRLFFTYEANEGYLRGFRWEMRPAISFNYSPNYLATDYYREVQEDVRFPDEVDTYSIFEGNIFGSPPRQEEQLSLGYSINNIFQAKTFSRRDSSVNKVKLIDNIIISGNYNFAADSLKWSPISMRTTTRLFKGVTTVGFSSTFDPYQKDASGRRIDEWTGFKGVLPFRFDNATLRFNSNLTVSKIRALFQGKDEEVVTDVRNRQNRQSQRNDSGGDDFLSLFESFSISHNMVFNWKTDSNGETDFDVTTNSLNCRGNIQLTQNWGFNVGNFGYDFVRKGLSYPSIGINRDLHCWQMNFDWAPTRGTYSFTIRVKPGTLDFIKIPYQRNNYDTNAFR